MIAATRFVLELEFKEFRSILEKIGAIAVFVAKTILK